MKLKEVLIKTTDFFKQKNSSSPRLDAELLIGAALGMERLNLYLQFDYELKEDEIHSCRELARRRGQGEPVSYILNEKGFYKDIFYVDERVLIPRPETELLVEYVIRWVTMNMKDKSNLKIADFGTGSGCIGLTLLKELSAQDLFAVDISSAALEVAQKNVEKLNLKGRVTLFEEDIKNLNFKNMAKKFQCGFEIIVANPPYINEQSQDYSKDVKKYEPNTALFAEENGTKLIKEWALKAAEMLKPGGLYCCEIGYDQGLMAREYLMSLKVFNAVEIIKDYSGQDRVVCATRGELVNG